MIDKMIGELKGVCDQQSQRIAELEAKLADMTKKYELASLPVGGLVDTARNLEKQLAEKEQEQTCIYNFGANCQKVKIKTIDGKVFDVVNDKGYMAIKELEKLRDWIFSVSKSLSEMSTYSIVVHQINNQIKQLKE